MAFERCSTGHRAMAVLVIDPSDSSRRQLTSDLVPYVGKVAGSRTANDGMQQLRGDPFDAVVLDLSLPDVSGIDLIPLLHRRHPQLRVVIVTGLGSIASSVRAIKLGAVDYLLKPVSAARVAAALRGLPTPDSAHLEPEMSLDRVTWEHIHRVLDDSNGNVSEAARRLGLHRQSLQRKLRKVPRLLESARE